MPALPSVLFVSYTANVQTPYRDPSTRYRCFNFAQELQYRGHRAEVTTQARLVANPDDFLGYDRYVFHRPLFDASLGRFLAELPRGHASADFDDLIFDVARAADTPMVRVRGSPVSHVSHYVSTTAESLNWFSRASLSTVPLAERVLRGWPSVEVSVLHNRVDRAFISLARAVRGANPWGRRRFRFGYFSGTATHDHDLKVAAPAVAAALEADRGARMLVVGPVQLPECLEPYRDRFERRDLVPFHRLVRVMAECQRVIAPLEWSGFTECKSGLKYFEAALAGCEVAATPIPDIARFDSPLLWKCATPEDWMDALQAPRRVDAGLEQDVIAELEQGVGVHAAMPEWGRSVGLEMS